jgi:hypothetical protein
MFGEDFSGYQPEAPEDTGDASQPATTAAKDKAKRGKVAAKATGHTYQFQIMESVGVPRAEIKKFADPAYWLEYFPPIAQVSIHTTMRIDYMEINSLLVARSSIAGNPNRLAPIFHND